MNKKKYWPSVRATMSISSRVLKPPEIEDFLLLVYRMFWVCITLPVNQFLPLSNLNFPNLLPMTISSCCIGCYYWAELQSVLRWEEHLKAVQLTGVAVPARANHKALLCCPGLIQLSSECLLLARWSKDRFSCLSLYITFFRLKFHGWFPAILSLDGTLSEHREKLNVVKGSFSY